MVGNPAWRATWGLTKRGEARYLSVLWSPERMVPRCELFSRLCAPQLQAMAGRHDYRHVVLHSPGLPEPWLGQLRATVQEHPVLELVPVDGPELPSPTTLAKTLVPGRRVDSGPVVTFRVDDDDLLAVDFLDHLAEYANYADRGRAVNLPRGFTSVWDESRLSMHDLRPVLERFGGRGQAFVGWYDAESGALDDLPERHEPHSKIDQFRPVVHDARHPAFLWTQHVHQDSHQNRRSGTPLERIETFMAKFPAGSADDVAEALRLFPVLHGRLEMRDRRAFPSGTQLRHRVRRWRRRTHR
jgi:hypothetical protein